MRGVVVGITLPAQSEPFRVGSGLTCRTKDNLAAGDCLADSPELSMRQTAGDMHKALQVT